jgi:hypothetical protein
MAEHKTRGGISDLLSNHLRCMKTFASFYDLARLIKETKAHKTRCLPALEWIHRLKLPREESIILSPPRLVAVVTLTSKQIKKIFAVKRAT